MVLKVWKNTRLGDSKEIEMEFASLQQLTQINFQTVRFRAHDSHKTNEGRLFNRLWLVHILLGVLNLQTFEYFIYHQARNQQSRLSH